MGTDIDTLIKSLSSLDKTSFANDASRFQAAEAARSLFLRLESPYERFKRYGYTEVSAAPRAFHNELV